ncbi:DUF3806 domain-containing protein [Ornithinimicrobium sp. Y1847]|uniref:hypothetical protein n=1 Tax=unclassified Ornithinimicrobium TaxID=2615080 RepID=UPI003B66D82F
MGLFDKVRSSLSRGEDDNAPRPERLNTLPEPEAPVGDLPLKPEIQRIGESERERIAAGIAALEEDGVDIDDLASLGAGYDRALARWIDGPEGDHGLIVDRIAMGVGEHLARHTDLAWEIVTDVFGTDLAVTAGDFVVVPNNLVAVRWMRRETGWVVPVVGHLVTLRNR